MMDFHHIMMRIHHKLYDSYKLYYCQDDTYFNEGNFDNLDKNYDNDNFDDYDDDLQPFPKKVSHHISSI